MLPLRDRLVSNLLFTLSLLMFFFGLFFFFGSIRENCHVSSRFQNGWWSCSTVCHYGTSDLDMGFSKFVAGGVSSNVVSE